MKRSLEDFRKWKIEEALRFYGVLVFVSDCVPLDILNPILSDYASIHNYC